MSSAGRFVSPAALQVNTNLVAWARTLVALVAGLCVGICGVTGVAGLGAYLCAHAAVSVALLARMRFAPSDYFVDTSSTAFVASGAVDNVLLFLVSGALGFGGLWVF